MKKSELRSIIRECILKEGYESKVLDMLDDAGIEAWFVGGVLHIMGDKKDEKRAYEILDSSEQFSKIPTIRVEK